MSLSTGSSLVNIQDNVFGENNLTSVNIPDSVKYIGEYCFYDNEISEVILGSSLEEIEEGVFYENMLKELIVPDSIKRLGLDAFYGSELTSVELPAHISPYYVFYDQFEDIDFKFRGFERSDIDGDNSTKPLGDGLIVATAALAIEVAAGDEFAPAVFANSVIDKLTNPQGKRSEIAWVKNHLQEFVSDKSLDHNDNQMLDIHDVEHFIRSAMGTYPGQALITDCCADPTKLISIEEQLTVIDEAQLLA